MKTETEKKKSKRRVSVSIDPDKLEEIRVLAQKELRSISKQIMHTFGIGLEMAKKIKQVSKKIKISSKPKTGVSVSIESNILEEIKILAKKEARSVSSQIMYIYELGETTK